MNKKIVALMCGLAVVAVATVGFSAWVVGIQQTETTSGASISVDVVTNDTQYLAADMSGQTIVVAETKEHNRSGLEIIGSESVGVDANALKFTFTSLSVTLGQNATSNYTKVVIELDEESNDFLTTSENKVGRNGVSRTYLQFDEVEINFKSNSTYFTSSTKDGYTTYTLDTSKINVTDGLPLKLKWGTYFNNGSPVTYYNGLNKVSDSTEDLLNRATGASSELTTMKSVLENKENKITFKLSLA